MKHTITLVFLLLTTITLAQIPSYVPSNGLVGWWPFNSNANDESGNGNNGTVNGATLTTDRFGVVDKAYSFDGVNDVISINAQSSIAQTSDYTVSLWFNSPTGTYNGAFLSFQSWFCKLGHDFPGLFYKDEIGNPTNTFYIQQHFFVEPTINIWHQLIIKKSGTNVSISLDGQSIGSVTSYGFMNFNPSSLIQFGFYCCGIYYQGKLDDIGIWNRALTACEIQDLYHAQLGFTTVEAGPDQTICIGELVTLQGSGGSSLTWNNGVVDGVSFEPTQTNSYVLSGSDSLGCIGIDTVLVSVLEATTSSQSQTAIDSYTWPVNGQTYTQSGVYIDTLVNAAGCDSIVTLNLELDFTGIESNTPTTFKLYPNPVKDELFIKGMQEAVLPFEVYSTDGKKVLSGNTSGAIDVNALKKGSYQLKIKEQAIPFVKQ